MTLAKILPWAPATVLGLGSALLLSTGRQAAVPLARPIPPEVPAALAGFSSYDLTISPEERRVAGMSNYLLRIFSGQDSIVAFSVYVGYYESQTQGRSIHSPKNCLPGAGWEPLSSGTTTIPVAGGKFYQVNRYVLANGPVKAVVYYWYQGRGRIAANEYAVKWELLRDKALRGRSEETLVRIVVPVGKTGEETADSLATQVAAETIPAVFRAIPQWTSSPAG